ncbi:MAG: rod-binding protein [Nitrospinae bacterium]|nr:rod-binding protein [Nitrospinota bacterium]
MTVDKGLEEIKKSAGQAPGGNMAMTRSDRRNANPPSPLYKGELPPASAQARGGVGSGGTPADDKLKSLARQFESLLVFQMMTAMRETLPKSDLLGSFSGDMYQSMQDETLANEMTKHKGIGLTDMIYRQLVRLDEKARAGQAPGGNAATPLTRSPESESPIAPLYQRGEGGILQEREISALRARGEAELSAAARRPDSASLKAVKNYEVAP